MDSSSSRPRKFAWKKDKTRIETILKLPLQQITHDTFDLLSKKIISSISELQLEANENSEIVQLFLQGYTSEMYCDLFASLLLSLQEISSSVHTLFRDQLLEEFNIDCTEDQEEQIIKYSKRRQALCALLKSCLDKKILDYLFYSSILDILVEKLAQSTNIDLQTMFVKCIKELSIGLNDVDFANLIDSLAEIECTKTQSVVKFVVDEILKRKPAKKQEQRSRKKIREQFEQENESNKQHSYTWLLNSLQRQIEADTNKSVVYNFLNDLALDDSTKKHIKTYMTGKKSNEKWTVLRELVDAVKKRIKPGTRDHIFNYKPQRVESNGWETVNKQKKQSGYTDPTIQSDFLTVFLATVTNLEKRQKTKAENLAENRQLVINFIKHRHQHRSKSYEELLIEISDLEKGTRVKEYLKGIEKTIKYFIADTFGVEPEVLTVNPYTSEQKETIEKILKELVQIACAR